MTTDLATVRQLRNPSELPERDRGAAEAVASGLRGAKADNTRRACESSRSLDRWSPRTLTHPGAWQFRVISDPVWLVKNLLRVANRGCEEIRMVGVNALQVVGPSFNCGPILRLSSGWHIDFWTINYQVTR